MDKFIPKAKLSKKAGRERAKAQRQTWGGINPVTRKPKNPDAYVREKPRIESDDDTGAFSIPYRRAASPRRPGGACISVVSAPLAQKN
jgi:hypothetical protein